MDMVPLVVELLLFFKDDPEITVIGVGKIFAWWKKSNVAISRGLNVYVPEKKK